MFGRQVFEVADGIWCIRRSSYLTCSYAVKTPGGVVLVDAGMDSSAGDLEAALRVMGQPTNAVKAILLTHWHNDHAAGAQVMQQLASCPVYYHAAETPYLTRESARGGLRGWLSRQIPEWGVFVLLIGLLGEAVPLAVTASEHVADGQVVANNFEAIYTPGHTPGHVSYYYAPAKALFAGDALAVIGGQVRFMARPVTLDLPQARESMQRCLDREIRILCPGHREPLTENVGERCAEMRQYLAAQGKWPLLG